MQLARAAVDGNVRHGEVEGETFHELEGNIYTRPQRTGLEWPLAEVHLLAPVTPGRILFVMGGFLPPDVDALPPGQEPWMLPKAVETVSGPGAVVVAPPGTGFWVEPELAIVIGKEIHNASEAASREAILGYTCFNDITVPDSSSRT